MPVGLVELIVPVELVVLVVAVELMELVEVKESDVRLTKITIHNKIGNNYHTVFDALEYYQSKTIGYTPI